MTAIQIPTYEHIAPIIALNRKYLIDSLAEQQKQNGFIRIAYDRNDLQQIITNKEIVIATHREKVIGYYLIGRKSDKVALDYQRNQAYNLFDTNHILFNNIGYGCQVCIDEAFRNNGLFKKMLIVLTKQVKAKYSHLLCSVSNSNTVSLKKHTDNGWLLIDTFETTKFLIYKTNII